MTGTGVLRGLLVLLVNGTRKAPAVHRNGPNSARVHLPRKCSQDAMVTVAPSTPSPPDAPGGGCNGCHGDGSRVHVP
jgi:hypothetical protein